MEGLKIANTFFKKSFDKQWTHDRGGRKRQIDFFFMDRMAFQMVRDVEATDLICLGADHRGVVARMVVEGPAERNEL